MIKLNDCSECKYKVQVYGLWRCINPDFQISLDMNYWIVITNHVKNKTIPKDCPLEKEA